MKTKFFNLKTWHSVFLIPIAAGALAQNSVVIEAGPNGVTIADQDGELETGPATPETVVPGTATPIVPGPIVPGIGVEGISTSSVRPNGAAIVTTPVPVTPPPAENDVITRTEPQPGERLTPTAITATRNGMEVVKIQRRAELTKELNVLENAVGARLVIRTKNMFGPENEQIDPAAYSLLNKVAEYLKLSPLTKVDLAYVQDYERISKEKAWERTVTLTSWLKTYGSVNTKEFAVKQPQFSTVPDTEDKPVEEGGEKFGEYIVMNLHQ